MKKQEKVHCDLCKGSRKVCHWIIAGPVLCNSCYPEWMAFDAVRKSRKVRLINLQAQLRKAG